MNTLKCACLVATAIMLNAVTYAEAAKAAKPKLSKEERDRIIMEKVGGLLELGSKGAIAVINAQKTYDVAKLQGSVESLSKSLKCKIFVTEGAFSIQGADGALTSCGGSVGIFVVDDPSLPLSLTSPEGHWGVVNVAKLKDGAEGEKLDKRVTKEFCRVVGFTLGSGLSKFKTSIMKPMSSAADLDRVVPTELPFDAVMTAYNALPDYGIVYGRKVPYRQACKEGWAPAPTNAQQKAIWDEYKSKPTEPIKIKFDPKKGE